MITNTKRAHRANLKSELVFQSHLSSFQKSKTNQYLATFSNLLFLFQIDTWLFYSFQKRSPRFTKTQNGVLLDLSKKGYRVKLRWLNRRTGCIEKGGISKKVTIAFTFYCSTYKANVAFNWTLKVERKILHNCWVFVS